MDQVSYFSRDRLRKGIEDGPVFRHNMETAQEEEGKEAISQSFVEGWSMTSPIG